MPRVMGCWVSATKLFSVCGALSSLMVQSSLVRWGTRLPCLSFTVKKTSTRLTLTLKVAVGISSAAGAGAWLTGGASGEGASWAHAAAEKPGRPDIGRPSNRAAIPKRVFILVI